jgi:uncharacterized protein YwgA
MFKTLIRKIHSLFIKAPLWYIEDEIYEWLKSEAYSPEIAEELTRLWTSGLQKAYTKGYRRGYRANQEVHDFTLKANKLRVTTSVDQAYDEVAGTIDRRAEDLRVAADLTSNERDRECMSTQIITLKLLAKEIRLLKGV